MIQWKEEQESFLMYLDYPFFKPTGTLWLVDSKFENILINLWTSTD